MKNVAKIVGILLSSAADGAELAVRTAAQLTVPVSKMLKELEYELRNNTEVLHGLNRLHRLEYYAESNAPSDAVIDEGDRAIKGISKLFSIEKYGSTVEVPDIKGTDNEYGVFVDGSGHPYTTVSKLDDAVAAAQGIALRYHTVCVRKVVSDSGYRYGEALWSSSTHQQREYTVLTETRDSAYTSDGLDSAVREARSIHSATGLRTSIRACNKAGAYSSILWDSDTDA